MNPIHGLGALVPPTTVDPAAALDATAAREAAARDGGFGKLLADALERSFDTQVAADGRVADHLAGGDVGLIETTVGLKQADLSLRLMIQIRNKLLEAYQEIRDLRI